MVNVALSCILLVLTQGYENVGAEFSKTRAHVAVETSRNSITRATQISRTSSADITLNLSAEGIESISVIGRSERFYPRSNESQRFSFGSVSIDIPAGAWPSSATSPLRMYVIDQKALKTSGSLVQSLNNLQGRFAGNIVYFEPSGVQFAKPVTIGLGFDPSLKWPSNMSLVVNVFDTQHSIWIRKEWDGSPSDRIDFTRGVVYAEIQSFSLYAPLILPEPPMLLPDLPGGLDSLQIALIIGCSVGIAGCLVFVAFDRWSRQRAAVRLAEEKARSEREEAAHAQVVAVLDQVTVTTMVASFES